MLVSLLTWLKQWALEVRRRGGAFRVEQREKENKEQYGWQSLEDTAG